MTAIGDPLTIYEGVRLDLIADIEREILTRAVHLDSYPSLNQGAWKSDERAFAWPDSPALRALGDEIARLFLPSWKLTAWAMVNRKGSFHPLHRHQSARTSGVYYVTPGDPPVPTIFEVGGRDVEIAPKVGTLVLFPGQLWHRVPVYDGASPRITIAFDARR